MAKLEDYNGYQPTWCPGCGDWGIGIALKQALVQLNLTPDQVAIVFGIGCSGNMNDFINAYGFHGLHGRAIANAIGIKIANHNLPVIAAVGDGDCYGEGGNHLIHAARGNHDITVVVHDNGVYGLTTGQVAPTARKGTKSKSTPLGLIERPVNPLALSLTQGATFVAQAFAGDTLFMIDIIKKAILHRGFSIVNILQPCVTFNKVNTYDYYRQRVYKLGDDYDPSDYQKALVTSHEIEQERYPLGIIYQTQRPVFTDNLFDKDQNPLIFRERFTNLNKLIENFL
jgi:2-oxoglutarate ferredoxin oxidoreductase subunit beta